jgi:A/G-specific adenine glycosylase
MLQQTRVTTAIPYYERFIAHYPTLGELAIAPKQVVLKLWEGLGYYRRCLNLQKACQTVAVEHRGLIPENYAEFRALPGVGDYIAAAVMSIAFGLPHAVVDGNVKRVLSRMYAIETPVNLSSAAKVFLAYAQALLPTAQAGSYNQALMELGALVCLPRKPKCEDCPWRAHCQAAQKRAQADFPKRKAKPSLRTEKKQVVLQASFPQQIPLQQRPDDGLLPGLWELPFATDAETGSCTYLGKVKHVYSHFAEEVEIYIATGQNKSVSPKKLYSEQEMSNLPLTGITKKVIELAQKKLEDKSYPHKSRR